MIENRVTDPMIDMKLFKIRAFTAGNIVNFTSAMARGGLQFILIIWLQGIWLPLHGYAFVDTPLWAGIYMLPLTVGFLVAGPVSGALSDRFGATGLHHRRPDPDRPDLRRADAHPGRLQLRHVRRPCSPSTASVRGWWRRRMRRPS